MALFMPLVTLEQIEQARERIAGVAVRTGLYRLDLQHARGLGFTLPDDLPTIWLKAENEQPIGSFKLRGAYNKVASLTEDELARGVVAHSSGNHAQGVAYAAKVRGAKATIVMPEIAPRIKRDATASHGAEIVLVGPASSERIATADRIVRETGAVLVPPYDDDLIIAGQGTCGLEILEQLPEADLVLSPVSGGGLLSGIATAIKSSRTDVRVWGAEPELAGDAAESFRRREIVEWPGSQTSKTIADGLRTQSLAQRTYNHIVAYVDGILTVTEDEILEATRLLLTAAKMVAEPSGAVTLAAALFHAEELPASRNVVCVVSGGNLDPALRQELIEAES
ncbi:threonine ammonia-lyase [Terriglobus sp.]|uniref:threonine ammonia-lyase n=1 Tax=Terriglobus sp. TaxID=1889013 RepID=UPI003B008C3C